MGNLLLDASSPAIVYVGPSSTVTTASFTPPANSLLVVCAALNSGAGNSGIAVPTITDNLGAHLTYSLIQHCRNPDAGGEDGQAAMWSAPDVAGGALTVSITNNDAATGQAIKVWVFTDDSGGLPTIGANKENGRGVAGTAVADTVTATVNNSRGVIAYNDWDATTAPTAGTGCTLTGGGAQQQTAITYAFALRTTADGVNAATIGMNLTTASTSNARWVIAEVKPAVGAAAPPADGAPAIDWWPGDGPNMVERFTADPGSTDQTVTTAVTVNAEATTHDLTTGDPTVTQTTAAADNVTTHTTTDAVFGLGVPATDAATAHTAADPTVALAATAGQGATTHTAADPAPSVAANAGDATTTHQTFDATVSTAVLVNVNAADAATTHTTNDPAVALAVTAADTVTTHTAGDPTAQVGATDTTAPALTHTTNDATVAAATNTTAGVNTHTASDITATATTTDTTNPTITHQTFDATVSTLAIVNANAGDNVTTHTTSDPAPSVAVTAGTGVTTHTTYDATVTAASNLSVNAADTITTHTTNPATYSIGPTAQSAANSHDTQTVTALAALPAQAPQLTLTAYDAIVTTALAPQAHYSVDTGLFPTHHPDSTTLASSIGGTATPAATHDRNTAVGHSIDARTTATASHD